jgi:hypothetical protein
MANIFQRIANGLIFEMIDKGFVELLANEFAKVITVKSIEIAVTSIQRLELKPGDVVILKCKIALSDAAFTRLKKSVESELFPSGEHKVMVLDEDMDIAVISEEEHNAS